LYKITIDPLKCKRKGVEKGREGRGHEGTGDMADPEDGGYITGMYHKFSDFELYG
jgi:hypothetical protein